MVSEAAAAQSDSLVEPWIALLATLVAAVIAVGWPTWRSWQTGRRFVRLIKRELEEIGPHIPENDPSASKRPWWQYLSKRFVHEQFLSGERIAGHREFVLSLDPTLVYLLSQLWIAFEKRDGRQWVYFLSELAENRKVTTEDLREAVEKWRVVLDNPQPTPPLRGSADERPAPVENVAGLFEARADAYRELMRILNPRFLEDERTRAALMREDGALAEWYRRFGLLLSGDSLSRYLGLREALEDDPDPREVNDSLSALRTELKIDLGVRHPYERDEPTVP